MLTIYNPQGQTIFDASTRLVKFLGVRVVGGVGTARTGSLSNTRFAGGRPFFLIHPENGWYNPQDYDPEVQISGNILRWRFPQAGNDELWKRPITTITYGIY